MFNRYQNTDLNFFRFLSSRARTVKVEAFLKLNLVMQKFSNKVTSKICFHPHFRENEPKVSQKTPKNWLENSLELRVL